MLQKQFDGWKLSTHLFYDAENKPYVDNDTAKGILEDCVYFENKKLQKNKIQELLRCFLEKRSKILQRKIKSL